MDGGSYTAMVRMRSGNHLFGQDTLSRKSFRDDSSCNDSRLGPAKKRESSVLSTCKLKRSKSNYGQKLINQYVIEKELGKGSFATVHLARDNLT